jgi:methylenetetrahydrofolate--tRNA-(uracil-5-)-methyltransferase
MLGALMRYLHQTNPKVFQPMNANFGLLPPLDVKVKSRRLKRDALVERSLKDLEVWIGDNNI